MCTILILKLKSYLKYSNHNLNFHRKVTYFLGDPYCSVIFFMMISIKILSEDHLVIIQNESTNKYLVI